MVKAETPQSVQWFDIEPLMAPGVDWVFWLGALVWGIAGLLAVLVAVAVLKNRRVWVATFFLKGRLRGLLKTAPSLPPFLQPGDCLGLYHWFIAYQAWLNRRSGQSLSSPVWPVEFAALLNAFNHQLQEACFSQHPVSRETYVSLLNQAQDLLTQAPQQESKWKR